MIIWTDDTRGIVTGGQYKGCLLKARTETAMVPLEKGNSAWITNDIIEILLPSGWQKLDSLSSAGKTSAMDSLKDKVARWMEGYQD